MIHPLTRWMNKSTAPEKRELAALARTTVATLRQIAGGYRTKGKPRASAELARRIEIGTVKLSAAREGRKLPVVLRTDLCSACSVCEYAKTCKG